MNSSAFSFEKIKSSLLSNKSFKIVFLGDSITSTEWVHPNWREIVEYVVKFKLVDQMDDWKIPEWNIRCINSGYDGATMQDLLDRLDEAVVIHKPDLAIFVEGAGDLVDTMTKKDYLTLAKKFVNQIARYSQNLIFCGSIPTNNPKLNEKIQPYIDELKSFLPKPNVQFVNLFEELQKFNLEGFFTFISPWGITALGMKPGEIDWVHPNQLGNAYIAKVILEKGFDIPFDPEKYIRETLGGKMYPGY